MLRQLALVPLLAAACCCGFTPELGSGKQRIRTILMRMSFDNQTI
jgi:hypothetical protein